MTRQAGRITPTDEELGRRVRQTAWNAAARTATTGAARDQVVVAAVKANHPRAVQLLGEQAEDVIVALTHEPEPGRCNWDRYRAALAEAGKQLPWPPPPALRGALGAMCVRCRVAFDAVAVAKREGAHIAAVVAAGLKPSAAGRYRSAAVARKVAAEMERLRQAPLKRRR